jgi:hypothetical protein
VGKLIDVDAAVVFVVIAAVDDDLDNHEVKCDRNCFEYHSLTKKVPGVTHYVSTSLFHLPLPGYRQHCPIDELYIQQTHE